MAPSRGPQPLARTQHVVLDGHRGAVNVARYSKGSAKYVLTGGQDRTVRLWNANLGTEVKTFASHGYEVLSITVYVQPSLWRGISRKHFEAPRIMPNSRPLAGIVLSFCGTLQVVLPRGVLQHIWARYTSLNLIRMQQSLRAVIHLETCPSCCALP